MRKEKTTSASQQIFTISDMSFITPCGGLQEKLIVEEQILKSK